MTESLAELPIRTAQGSVDAPASDLDFGYRGTVSGWIYRHRRTKLSLCFGFLPIYTVDDLICKVVPTEGDTEDTASPSIQLNADQCFARTEGYLQIWHHGRIAPTGRSLARPAFIETVRRVAPDAVNLYGGLDDDARGWSTWIGDTRDVGALLDRLFAYCYGVEQVRRHVMREPLLRPHTRQGRLVRRASTLDEDFELPEGREYLVTHRQRERRPELVAEKKARELVREGRLTCAVCGFDFSEHYPLLGQGFIECHHTIPVSQMKPGQKTNLRDLALVCSNCHRMLHVGSRGGTRTVAELRQIVETARQRRQ